MPGVGGQGFPTRCLRTRSGQRYRLKSPVSFLYTVLCTLGRDGKDWSIPRNDVLEGRRQSRLCFVSSAVSSTADCIFRCRGERFEKGSAVRLLQCRAFGNLRRDRELEPGCTCDAKAVVVEACTEPGCQERTKATRAAGARSETASPDLGDASMGSSPQSCCSESQWLAANQRHLDSAT